MERLTRRGLWWGSRGQMDKSIDYKVDEERRCVTHEGSSDFLIADKLAEYEDLEEQGKLIKLPCAVGDTVYRVHKGNDLSPTRIYECRVTAVKQEYNTVSVKLYSNINEATYSILVDNWFDKCQIGYEFFLTENEALQKTNEMEGKE